MNYLGYGCTRVSTKEQAEQGHSGIDRQLADISAVAKSFGVEICETFNIVDVSGACVLESPEFQRLLTGLENNPSINCVVVSSLDRLTRAIDFDIFAVYSTFLRHKKLIFTATNGLIDVSKPEGFLQALIGGWAAGNELNMWLKRVRDSKEVVRKAGADGSYRGRWRLPEGKNTLPFGVNYNPETSGFSYVEPYRSKVKEAFRLVLEGHSSLSIAKMLEYKNCITLHDHLRNKIWIGYREYKYLGSDERHKSRTPGKRGDRKKVLREKPLLVRINNDAGEPLETLVSEEDFYAVQERLTSRGRKHWWSARTRRSKFELLGIARCACCGMKLYPNVNRRSNGKEYYYYVSRSRKLKLGCRQKAVAIEELHQTVHTFIRTFFKNTEILRQLLAKVSNRTTPSFAVQQERIEQAKAAINRLQQERAKLLRLARTDQFTEEEAAAEAKVINSEINGWNAAITQAQSELRPPLDERSVATAIAEIFAGFGELPVPQRKDLIQKYISGIYSDGGTLTKVIVRLPVEFVKMEVHLDAYVQFPKYVDAPIEPATPFVVLRPEVTEKALRNAEILGLFAKGYSRAEIAKRMNLHHSVVGKVITADTYEKRGSIKQSVADFLSRSGPIRRRDIASAIGLSQRSVNGALRDKKIFRRIKGTWTWELTDYAKGARDIRGPRYQECAAKKKMVADLILKNGPAQRKQIVAGTGMRPGTVTFVLQDKTMFCYVDGKWQLINPTVTLANG